MKLLKLTAVKQYIAANTTKHINHSKQNNVKDTAKTNSLKTVYQVENRTYLEIIRKCWWIVDKFYKCKHCNLLTDWFTVKWDLCNLSFRTTFWFLEFSANLCCSRSSKYINCTQTQCTCLFNVHTHNIVCNFNNKFRLVFLKYMQTEPTYWHWLCIIMLLHKIIINLTFCFRIKKRITCTFEIELIETTVDYQLNLKANGGLFKKT